MQWTGTDERQTIYVKNTLQAMVTKQPNGQYSGMHWKSYRNDFTTMQDAKDWLIARIVEEKLTH